MKGKVSLRGCRNADEALARIIEGLDRAAADRRRELMTAIFDRHGEDFDPDVFDAAIREADAEAAQSRAEAIDMVREQLRAFSWSGVNEPAS